MKLERILAMMVFILAGCATTDPTPQAGNSTHREEKESRGVVRETVREGAETSTSDKP